MSDSPKVGVEKQVDKEVYMDISEIRELAERGEEIIGSANQKLDNINEAIQTLEQEILPFKQAVEQFDEMDSDAVTAAIDLLEGEGVS